VRQVEAESARPVDESIVKASAPSVREVHKTSAPSAREVGVPVERHEAPEPQHIPEFVQNISAQRPLFAGER